MAPHIRLRIPPRILEYSKVLTAHKDLTITHTLHTPRTFENSPTVLHPHHRGPLDLRQQVVFQSLTQPRVFFTASTHSVSQSFCLSCEMAAKPS